MPIVFSPIDQSELKGPFKPLPRTAFVMRQLSGIFDPDDQILIDETNAALRKAKLHAITAADIRGTSDFLKKIIDLIRGSGFAIAIFSDRTPPKALANIFFEVGIASILGKPVQLVMTGDNPAPSDFVRTEWIAYKKQDRRGLRRDLAKSLREISALGPFYRKLGEVALDGDVDLELAFERFRQAILVSDDRIARRRLAELRDRLVRRAFPGSDDLASHQRKLREAVSHFLKLLPRAKPIQVHGRRAAER